MWNCVGSGNHRQFLLFVTTLVIGIGLFDYLAYACTYLLTILPTPFTYSISVFTTLPLGKNPQDISPSCPLPADLCNMTTHDPFLVSVAFWATLQLTWTSILLASQYWQVARQMTTLEVSNLGRYGFMGGRVGAGLSTQMGARHQQQGGQTVPGVDSEDTSLVGGDGGSVASGPHAHRHSGRNFILNLLGFDRFTKGKAVDGLAKASKANNPFDVGVVGNCRDFWTNGRELGVEYEKLYDVPLEGFKEAKKRRGSVGGREDEDEGRKNAPGTARSGLFMGLASPFSARGARGQGYEPVSQV